MAPWRLAHRSARDGGRPRRSTASQLAATGSLALALLSATAHPAAAADATWKTHRDGLCGIELRYPPAYDLEASGAPDHRAAWMSVGVRGARGFRTVLGLEIREMESVHRAEASRSGPPVSVRAFALHEAAARCMADGPGGSAYCVEGEVRPTFRTTQGFRGFEIDLTEIRE